MPSDRPTIEDIEDAIPERRKNLSFGGPDEDILDVMEQSDRESHERGLHADDPRPECPLCDASDD